MNNHSKWKIFRANLEPVVGSEQGKSRPVLIISRNEINKLLNCVNIIPITSHKGRKVYPNEVFLPLGTANLSNDSIALCHQIRTIDKKWLSREYGVLNDETIKLQLIEAIKFQLEI